MNIQITGRQVEVTDALKQYIDTKFSRLERHFDHINNVHVILTVEKENKHCSEAKVSLSGGELFAQSDSENMYASIDLLIDKLDRQLIKHKEKLQNHSGNNRQVFDQAVED